MMSSLVRSSLAMAAMLAASSPLLAHPAHTQPAQVSLPVSAQAAAATVDRFHAALRRGDTRGALLQLSDDALIFEGGGVERSKAEYRAHHLGADAEFSQAVPSTVTRRTGGANGAIAWIATEGTLKGSFRGKSVDRVTAETMVLKRVGGAWRITHIHWSSAAAKASAPASAAAVAVPLLAGSTPANGAVAAAPVNRIELHFSPPARLLEVIVTGPDGPMPMMVTSVGESAHYSLPVSGLGPGSYSVDYRASAAGREDRGSFAFTVR